ncbi:hypothetical protein D3C84_1195520 [compost metagenome]
MSLGLEFAEKTALKIKTKICVARIIVNISFIVLAKVSAVAIHAMVVVELISALCFCFPAIVMKDPLPAVA